jgi:hypothetical protein
MATGTGSTFTLYDKNGNAVTVRQENLDFKVLTSDDVTRGLLTDILAELRAIRRLEQQRTGQIPTDAAPW